MYDELDLKALETGLCDVFVDNVNQVKVKVEHSLHVTPSDNWLTGSHSSNLSVA